MGGYVAVLTKDFNCNAAMTSGYLYTSSLNSLTNYRAIAINNASADVAVTLRIYKYE